MIIVGGGITGLVLAVAARERGHNVTLVARDTPRDTASGMAAGMIAPTLEALGDPDPVSSFKRLHRAQAAWFDLLAIWPQTIKSQLVARGLSRNLYVYEKADRVELMERLKAMGAQVTQLDEAHIARLGFDATRFEGVSLHDDWLMDPVLTLNALHDHFVDKGGVWVTAKVMSVGRSQVILNTGETLEADSVILAAGYDAQAFASQVASLACLMPIKGHLLDIEGEGSRGVLRTDGGYFADHGEKGKFGATMQVGQADLVVEPDIVAMLKNRSAAMSVETGAAVPRTGVRAASPDGWPLIGRDAASGVYVATAMRRNGYVFAPFTAQIILALIEGAPAPDMGPDIGLYRPDRF